MIFRKKLFSFFVISSLIIFNITLLKAESLNQKIGNLFEHYKKDIGDKSSLIELEHYKKDIGDKSSLIEVVSELILKISEEDGCSEKKDSREIKKGDLNDDGVDDTMVTYTVEGCGGGNNWHSELAVFINEQSKWIYKDTAPIGSGNIESVNNGIITVKSLEYDTNDPRCCPSIEIRNKYALRNDKLIEINSKEEIVDSGFKQAEDTGTSINTIIKSFTISQIFEDNVNRLDKKITVTGEVTDINYNENPLKGTQKISGFSIGENGRKLQIVFEGYLPNNFIQERQVITVEGNLSMLFGSYGIIGRYDKKLNRDIKIIKEPVTVLAWDPDSIEVPNRISVEGYFAKKMQIRNRQIILEGEIISKSSSSGDVKIDIGSGRTITCYLDAFRWKNNTKLKERLRHLNNGDDIALKGTFFMEGPGYIFDIEDIVD